jgi:hypothetical protein
MRFSVGAWLYVLGGLGAILSQRLDLRLQQRRVLWRGGFAGRLAGA